MNWFTKFFSLDEQKTSSMIFALLAFGGIGIYCVLKYGDIPPNVASIIETLIIAISGANAIGWASNSIMNRYSSYGNQYGYGGYNQYGSYGYGNSVNTSMGMGMNGMNTMGTPLSPTLTSTPTTPPPEQMPIVNTGASNQAKI